VWLTALLNCRHRLNEEMFITQAFGTFETATQKSQKQKQRATERTRGGKHTLHGISEHRAASDDSDADSADDDDGGDSSDDSDDDGLGVIVFDNGASSVKAGFGGEMTPAVHVRR
jgi:hypothetical protein